jgi:hypothetical protein
MLQGGQSHATGKGSVVVVVEKDEEEASEEMV